MARTPRDRLAAERNRVKELAAEGKIGDSELEAIFEWADALDEGTASHKYRVDGDVKTFKPETVTDYMMTVRVCCREGLDLLDASAGDVNDLMDEMHDSGSRSKGTLAKYQSALSTFYRYHNLGVDPDEIHVYTPDSSPQHDELDMFEESEVDALRAACGDTQNPVRNRAFLELLIYTGQRITALLTLRLKDVDVDGGYIYLNDDYDREHGGLKGALARGRKRPMFGARKFVRDYTQIGRADADPDDWLFVGDPTIATTKEGEHWTNAQGMLKRLAETAGVEKPVNPHNFRHYCATVLKRDYDNVDDDTIRMLFGHVEGSGTLKKTYQHLFDEDYIEKAEVALGYKNADGEETPTFTPDACPTCGELLESDWRRCPNCDELFGPVEDFAEATEAAADHAKDEALERQDGASMDAALAITEAVDDPEAVAEEILRRLRD